MHSGASGFAVCGRAAPDGPERRYDQRRCAGSQPSDVLPRIARERVPTIPSASPHQIVKPSGLFAEARSIRPRNGSNPRLPGPRTRRVQDPVTSDSRSRKVPPHHLGCRRPQAVLPGRVPDRSSVGGAPWTTPGNQPRTHCTDPHVIMTHRKTIVAKIANLCQCLRPQHSNTPHVSLASKAAPTLCYSVTPSPLDSAPLGWR